MNKLCCLLLLCGTISAVSAPPGREVAKPEVLPLALSDQFQFRKIRTFLNDPTVFKPAANAMIQFQRDRADFGAVTEFDRKQRQGHYYTFFWRADQAADLTVRFEYRQANLGPYVLAKEVEYSGARGSHRTRFEVIGDDYLQDGKVTQWRALLIEGGKIVGLTQSYLWN